MPAATTEDPGTRTSTKEEVATQEIYLRSLWLKTYRLKALSDNLLS